MTCRSLFPALPDAARIWVFATREAITDTLQAQLLSRLRSFIAGWRSHGNATSGDAVIIDHRFLVVGGILHDGGALSGCSIDSLTRAIESAAQDLDTELLSPLAVFYRDSDGCVQSASRGAFRRLVKAGDILDNTPVFDLGVTTVGVFRGGAFEQPFCESWHARVFRQRAPAAV